MRNKTEIKQICFSFISDALGRNIREQIKSLWRKNAEVVGQEPPLS